MDASKIREAVIQMQGKSGSEDSMMADYNATQTLIKLAQAYLEAQAVMPEKRIEGEHEGCGDCCAACVESVRNKLIDLCTLAHMKQMAAKDRQIEILHDELRAFKNMINTTTKGRIPE